MDSNVKVDIKRKKNKYSISLKIEILDLVHKGVSLHEIEKKYKISRDTVRKWKDIEEELRAIKKKDIHYCNNRKGMIIRNFTDEEECIINFIIDARGKNKPISIRSVINFADTIKYEFSK